MPPERTSSPFSLLVFSIEPARVREASAAGVAHFIVDWEQRGKEQRQAGADTEINGHTVDDLRRVRAATTAHVICRLNAAYEGTGEEIERAIEAGADELLLPMVRGPREVESALVQVGARCQVGILIETREALATAADLALLPLSRIYVGLNDLAIEQKKPNLFTALIDGTVEQLHERLAARSDLPFGFGGLTLPDSGSPIPCRLLLGEMARLDCRFSFLRRSFWRDVHNRPLAREVRRIGDAVRQARARTPQEIAADREALIHAVEAWTRAAGRPQRPTERGAEAQEDVPRTWKERETV